MLAYNNTPLISTSDRQCAPAVIWSTVHVKCDLGPGKSPYCHLNIFKLATSPNNEPAMEFSRRHTHSWRTRSLGTIIYIIYMQWYVTVPLPDYLSLDHRPPYENGKMWHLNWLHITREPSETIELFASRHSIDIWALSFCKKKWKFFITSIFFLWRNIFGPIYHHNLASDV